MILFLILLSPMKTYAGEPTDTVKAHVEEVLNVLKASVDEDAKKTDIRNIAGRMFDFSSMSKATLGKNWGNFNEGQRSEFIRLLRSMLENAYISTMDSFCARVLKENPVEAGVDPQFSVLHDMDAELAVEYVMGEVMEVLSQDSAFKKFLFQYGLGRLRICVCSPSPSPCLQRAICQDE